MRKLSVAILLSVLSLAGVHAQDHEHHSHEHSRNEIGVSTGALYGFGHDEWGSGVHLHYYRTLKPDGKWSLGGGVEQAWLHGPHFNVGAGVKYQLLDRLSVSLFPGVSFISHKDGHEQEHDHGHGSSKSLFTLHGEAVYDIFHWEKYHLGVVADYSWEKNDRHGMIGVHAAYCF